MSIVVTKPARDRVQSVGDQYFETHKITTGVGDTTLTFKAARQSGAHCRKIFKIESVEGALSAVPASDARSVALVLPESSTIFLEVRGRRAA